MFNVINEIIEEYYNELNLSIESLSLHNEGDVSKLKSDVLTTNNITVGLTEDYEGIVLKIEQDLNLEKNTFTSIEIKTLNDINKIIRPKTFSGQVYNLKNSSFTTFGDMQMIDANNPLAIPVIDDKESFGWGSVKDFKTLYTIEKAKKDALDLWNKSVITKDFNSNTSYIIKVNNILDKLSAIIKRKAFLERRVHRYINEHKEIFLPQFKNCFFEHKLFLDDTYRKADFILERENGLAPLLIELESPIHKVLTNSYSLTSPSNHANEQINEWIEYIKENPVQNCNNEMNFLKSVNIEKLVIIGRGLKQKEILHKKRFGSTVFWTYEMLIEEARVILNNKYSSQCKLIGLNQHRPF